MKTKPSPKLLENYTHEDLGIYALLAAFSYGQKISSSNLSEEEVETLYRDGDKKFSEKKYQESFELFKEACIHDRLNKRGWNGMGMCCQLVGKSKEAISFYECASRIDHKDPFPVYGICNCHLALKQHLEAIEAAKKVVELCKKSPRFEYARLGESVEHLIECIDAIRTKTPYTILLYPKTLERPQSKLINSISVEKFWKKERGEGRAQELLFRKEVDSKKHSFYTERGIAPKKIEDLYALAYNYYTIGNTREAMKYFLLVSFYNHLDSRSWIGLGATLERKGLYDKAISAYKAAIKMNPKNPQPYFYISFCYELLSNKEEAEQFIEKAFQKINTGIEI